MNWLGSIGVGICSAPLTGLICGTAAAVAAEWMRIPQREGAAGFFAVSMTLLGALLGFLLAIAFARGWFGLAAGFGKSFGLTIAACASLASIVAGLAWLMADLEPKIDGRGLDLAFELRCPSGTPLPLLDESAYATFIRLADGESFGRASIEAKDVHEAAGRQIISSTLRIRTSTARKLLLVRLDGNRDLYFALDFGSKPRPKDFEWSPWIEAGNNVGEQRPSSEHAFALRYQVRLVEPPPPPPTREEEAAAADAQQETKMRALAPNASLAQWLEFTRYGVPQARIEVAAAAIRARPRFVAEMTHEMLEGEYESSHAAMRAIQHFQPSATELGGALVTVAHEIAQALHEFDNAPPEQRDARSNDIATRFSAWHDAAFALQSKDGLDFVPQLQEIIEPARRHSTNYAIRIDIVRVASFYLKEWGGIEPLPTDPPPR